MNNKKLLYILLGLGLLYSLSQLFNTKKDRSFDSEFLKIDTALITKIILHPQAEQHEEVVLEKTNGSWYASKQGKKVRTELGSVDGILKDLVQIQVKSVVTQSKDKLALYEISDSMGTRIQVYNASKKLADFYTGKFGFNPQANSMISYVRKSGENTVFALDGFQSMTFNAAFNNFRDKTILNVSGQSCESVLVKHDDAVLELKKLNTGWSLNNQAIGDTLAVQNYISTLQQINGADLIDQFAPGTAICTAQIKTTSSSTDLKVYPSGDSLRPFIVHSSANPEVYFKEDSNGVYNTVFKGMIGLK